MSKKPTSSPTRKGELPYDAKNKAATATFWSGAIQHTGLEELRKKRGRPPLAAGEGKEQIALRVDKAILAWYRAQGPGWQSLMNNVLRAYTAKKDRRPSLKP
ncbi:MAG: BrnA antitoxin family protein [Pseudomonadales bacterium]|jgi:uncharacterized protein (DUF4415 family)|nr:BrnA antitoxin family protein [Pseudomonadales bacterium]